MKELLYSILAVVIIIIIAVIIYHRPFKKSVPITKIKLFDFSYTNGYYMDANVEYILKYENGKYIASYKPLGVPSEDATLKEVDDSFSIEIENVLNEYNIGSWNGFSESNKNVLDGDSFRLDIQMEGNNEIIASGYMSWPKNYREFSQKISTMYSKVFDIDEKK